MDELKTNLGCASGCLGILFVVIGMATLLFLFVVGLYYLSVL